MTKFIKAQFDGQFALALDMLKQSEAITKRELRDLSRTVLNAHHETQDVFYVNSLIEVLTPVNKRAVILYFKEFGGFIYDDKAVRFVKKSKKQYPAAALKAQDFLADPHNNVWTWSDRNLKIEKQEYSLDQVTKTIQTAIGKSEKEGKFSKVDVLMAAFAGGFTVAELIEVMALNAKTEADKDGMVAEVCDKLGYQIAE